MCLYILGWQIYHLGPVCCFQVGKCFCFGWLWHSSKTKQWLQPGIPMAMLFFLSFWAFALANRMRSPAVSFRPEAKFITSPDVKDSLWIQTREIGVLWFVYEAWKIIQPFIDIFMMMDASGWLQTLKYPQVWQWCDLRNPSINIIPNC